MVVIEKEISTSRRWKKKLTSNYKDSKTQFLIYNREFRWWEQMMQSLEPINEFNELYDNFLIIIFTCQFKYESNKLKTKRLNDFKYNIVITF